MAVWLRWLCSLLLLAAIAASAAAQEDDEESPWRPGLVATYQTADAKATRLDECIAFDWQDASPDQRLPAGQFSAIWRGRLWTQTPGTFRLYCYVQGDVELKLDGKLVVKGSVAQPRWIVSQPIELPFGRHPLEVSFRKTGEAAGLSLFWSGPDFSLEPIPARFLMHDREATPPADFERGRQLAAALRCGACHVESDAAVLPAPALDRLAGNVNEPWLVEWLTTHGDEQTGRRTRPRAWRRMPDLAMTSEEATAVAAWLRSGRPTAERSEPKSAKEPSRQQNEQNAATKAKGKKKAEEERPRPSAEQGERLILTRGCLACHEYGDLGESGLFGGGDLTDLAKKRPSDFLVRWLQNPEAINRHHRMPRFTFTADELASLDLWAKAQAGKDTQAEKVERPAALGDSRELAGRGEQLVKGFRCSACHALPGQEEVGQASRLPALSAATNWSRSCAGQPDRTGLRPGYRLSAEDQQALKSYYTERLADTAGQESRGTRASPQDRGRDLLVQLNCLACHQREGLEQVAGTLRVPSADNGTRSVPATFADKLAAVAEAHDDLGPLVPAMTPPALNSVGDKLHEAALADAIRRVGPPHRPYLLVEMPKFRLSDEELADLTAYFIATDRIPSGAGVSPAENSGAGVSPAKDSTAGETPAPHILAAAGPRLVTTDGLACTSCHQVGSVQPVKAPLNARGPDISMLEKRIRREWFDRWCANPARIVPRMEMPSVQVPVRGVLGDNVRHQLAAVWHTLNTPGFEPPEPNPVRVLRLSGVPERKERPIVIHDVVKDGERTYLFPLVIGLPNRHNVLFDLETNRLAAWWLGDTARQRTKGKTWYWEVGSKPIFQPDTPLPELSLRIDDREYSPIVSGQSLVRLNGWNASEFALDYELQYLLPSGGSADGVKATTVRVFERIMPLQPGRKDYSRGFMRVFDHIVAPPGAQIVFRAVALNAETRTQLDDGAKAIKLPASPDGQLQIRLRGPANAHWQSDGSVAFKPSASRGTGLPHFLWLEYSTDLPPDRYLLEPPLATSVDCRPVDVAPGFTAVRLPLDDSLMATSFAWNSSGELFFSTLKGEVLSATDTDGDTFEDSLTQVCDGLPTPYGMYAVDERSIDVIAKSGLFRLTRQANSPHRLVTRIADGWGYTDDYHDWAVGLVAGDKGEYYLALPCQQDQRSEAAARFRGQFLKLVPRNATPDNPRLFDIEVLSSGHRFPMGIARNREGELFVTDNQGNYNPFNELDHVRKGAHFGFINALEKERGYKPPPLAEPAIDIPHPWTRSVNGICFLDTPEEMRGAAPSEGLPLAERADHRERTDHIYGPLEGHLVGCEYDTRRLIRMSLQRVGDTYQGAAYPLSMPPKDVESGLLGPIVCAVKPTTGELYVGEIRDSGWGAGNNIGQIVKIKIEPEKLPCGIAEVRATSTGFTIDFLQPVDRAKAADIASYSIASYRRESTPAYGGPDIERRTEKVARAEVSDDARRVTLTLEGLRAGHVYEFHLANLAPGGGLFFPEEAHYTLRVIPSEE